MLFPSAFKRQLNPRVQQFASAVSLGIVSATFAAGCGHVSNDAQALNWDSLPTAFTTECNVWTNPHPDSFVTNTPPPAEVRVRAATVEHTTGDRIKISLTFFAPPPLPPQIAGLGTSMAAEPGSVDFSFAVFPSGMNGPNDYDLFFQRDAQGEWTVSGSRTPTTEEGKEQSNLDSVVSEVDSARIVGNELIVELDLSQFPAVMREPVFAPEVQVSSSQVIARDPSRLPAESADGGPPETEPANLGSFMFATQNCSSIPAGNGADSEAEQSESSSTRATSTESTLVTVDPEGFQNASKAGSFQFATSDGNFTCGINLSGIAEGAGCHGAIPTEIACTVGGVATGSDCIPNTIFISANAKGIQQAERERYVSGDTAAVLNNNEALQVGGYTCVVIEDTVSCSDETGSEFTVSPTTATVI